MIIEIKTEDDEVNYQEIVKKLKELEVDVNLIRYEDEHCTIM